MIPSLPFPSTPHNCTEGFTMSKKKDNTSGQCGKVFHFGFWKSIFEKVKIGKSFPFSGGHIWKGLVYGVYRWKFVWITENQNTEKSFPNIKETKQKKGSLQGWKTYSSPLARVDLKPPSRGWQTHSHTSGGVSNHHSAGVHSLLERVAKVWSSNPAAPYDGGGMDAKGGEGMQGRHRVASTFFFSFFN